MNSEVLHRNLFLAAMPEKELSLLQPLLKPVDLPQGEVLAEPGEVIPNVLFLVSGMISLLTTMQDGSAIESATLGREAVFGVLAALGGHRANTRAVMQIAGRALQIRAGDFRAVVDKNPALRHLVLLSSELTLVQMQQTAACNALLRHAWLAADQDP